MAKKTVAAKKRVVKVDAVGQAHIHSSFNNIIVTLANSEGQVISWSWQVKWALEALRQILLMPLKWPHKIVQRWLLI